MLRMLVLALVLANAVYFAWAQGLLAVYGFFPARQSEPERLAQQVRPEAMQLLSVRPAPPATDAPPSPAPAPAAAAPLIAASAAPASAPCLQIGGFTEQQAQALTPRLRASLPADSWSFESSGDSVRWIIYMGRYINKDAINRKRLKLQQLGLAFDVPVSPMLSHGLSLGSFGSKAEAENALAQMNQRGIRSAKVILERPELPSQWLRLAAVDASLRTKLDALKPQLADMTEQACR